MDEAAELALLDQHLLKTNHLSSRMTNILAQLDTRLSRLDKAIAPLGIQSLSRKATNIDAALAILDPPPIRPKQAPERLKEATVPRSSSNRSIPTLPSSRSINDAASVQGYSLESPINAGPSRAPASSANDTAILNRGPDIMSLGEYFSALDGVIRDLETMWKGYTEGRRGAREAGVNDLSRLVEVGFQGLVQLMIKQAKDGMGKLFEPDRLLETGPLSPPHFFAALNTLLPLTTKVNSLLYPSPATPKTESLIRPIFDDAVSGLADLRGEWMRRSISGAVSHVEEIDEGGIWESGRGREKVKGLVGLWEVLLIVLEAETLVITTMFPNHPPPSLLPLTIAHPLNLVVSSLQPTLATIKKSLNTHIFVALDLFQSLLAVREEWDGAVIKCLTMTDAIESSSEEVLDVRNALAGPISTLRSLVSRSFPELLVDMRTAKTSLGSTSSLSDTTHTTLTYLEMLPSFDRTVEGLLSRSQSERSWLMGSTDTPSPASSAAEEGGIVNLYVADVLGTLLIHLNARAKTMRKPVGYAFLLNNLSHVRNTTSSFTSDIIGPGAEDMLNKAFREAKTQYLSEWHHLVSLLSSSHTPRFGANPLASSERTQLKEGASSFFDKFTELERMSMEHALNRQDPDMRDRISREVEEIVITAYRPFWGKCQGKGMEKYVRGTPDEVARRIQAMFR